MNYRRRKVKSALMQTVMLACALLVIAPLGFIFY